MDSRKKLMTLNDEITVAIINLNELKNKEINKLEFIELEEANLLEAMTIINQLLEK